MSLSAVDHHLRRMALDRMTTSCGVRIKKNLQKLGSNVGPKPPKQEVKRGFGRYQKTRRVNKIDFFA
jgi:hypothetical protein